VRASCFLLCQPALKELKTLASSALVNVLCDPKAKLNDNTIDWNDRVGLQHLWDNQAKGWQVNVEWKQTLYGVGLFAKQDIAKDTVLRIGRVGKNLVEFQSADAMLYFCQGNKDRVSYVADYFFGFDPKGDANIEDMWYGIWIPGNGLNHSPEPNTVYKAGGIVTEGIDLVALADIKYGDELVDDYRRHGQPPAWARKFSEEFRVSLNFSGCNDFV
jgi:hypothetical protein